MLLAIFLTILLISAIIQYCKGKEENGALLYFFFITDGFYLIPTSLLGDLPINKITDWGVIYLFFVVISKRNKIKRLIGPERISFIIFIYLTFNFLWTIITGKELFIYSLASYRTYVGFLSFVLFIGWDKLKCWTLLKKIISITIFTTILFVLQSLLNIQLIAQGSLGDTGTGVDGTFRYRNMPTTTLYLLVLSTLLFNFKSTKSIALLLLSIVAVLMTQFRGLIIAYICVLILLLYNNKMYRKRFSIFIVSISLISPIVFSVIIDRFSQEDTSNDIANIINMDIKNIDFNTGNSEGNFSFRILLFIERGKYLFEHPEYLLQGVGMRHDDSPITNSEFNFILATENYSDGGVKRAQTSSVDIAWVTPLFRFGIIGFYLYILLAIVFVKNFKLKSDKGVYHKSALYFYIMLIISSISFDYIYGITCLFITFLLNQYIKDIRGHNRNNSITYR